MHKETQDVLHNLLVLKRKTRAKDFVSTDLIKEHSITELLEDICSASVTDRCHSRSGKKFYIQDFRSTDQTITLLVNMIDPAKPSPVARGMSLSDDEREEMGIKPGWGLETSCHLVLSNKEDAKKQYVLLVEKTDGVSAANVAALLNKCLIRQAKLQEKKYMMPNPVGACDDKGEVKKIKTYYTVHVYGLPDEDFLKQISKGSLDSIELVGEDESLINGYDTQADPELSQITLGIDCSLSRTSQRAIAKLKDSIGLAKKIHIDKLRIKYKDESDFQRTANLDVEANRLIDSQRLVKKYRVPTPYRRNVSAVSVIDDTLEQAMRNLLR